MKLFLFSEVSASHMNNEWLRLSSPDENMITAAYRDVERMQRCLKEKGVETCGFDVSVHVDIRINRNGKQYVQFSSNHGRICKHADACYTLSGGIGKVSEMRASCLKAAHGVIPCSGESQDICFNGARVSELETLARNCQFTPEMLRKNVHRELAEEWGAPGEMNDIRTSTRGVVATASFGEAITSNLTLGPIVSTSVRAFEKNKAIRVAMRFCISATPSYELAAWMCQHTSYLDAMDTPHPRYFLALSAGMYNIMQRDENHQIITNAVLPVRIGDHFTLRQVRLVVP